MEAIQVRRRRWLPACGPPLGCSLRYLGGHVPSNCQFYSIKWALGANLAARYTPSPGELPPGHCALRVSSAPLIQRLAGEVVSLGIPELLDRPPWVESQVPSTRSVPAGSGLGDFSTARPPPLSGWSPRDQMAVGGGKATEVPWALPAGHVGVCGWMADGYHYPLDIWGSTEARSRPPGRDGRLVSST